MVAASRNGRPPETRAALSAVRAVNGKASDRLPLSNGIVLKIKRIPPLAIREAATRVKAPEVPMWYNEATERDEPNPNDPDFLAALEEYSNTQVMAISQVLMMLGTEVAELNGHDGPEANGWLRALRAAGVIINEDDEFDRYLAWLQYYALETTDDIASIMPATMALSGVSEQEVEKAAASFRDSAQRRTNPGRRATKLDSNGD